MSLIKVAEIAQAALIMALGVLYGLAYGVFGYYIAAAIDAAGAPTWCFHTWLLAWVAGGSVAVTVWAVRWTTADVRGGAR